MNSPQAHTSSCPALCDGKGADNETLIPCGDAKVIHGVCIRHGRMSTNGELRFRLNSSDGSAYIRTQTTGQSEGWQNPHYHKQLKETYIIEKGWIGYTELKDGTPIFRRYGQGNVFTTQPGVVHNIYMSADSVIHTVKHGGNPPDTSGGADWFKNKDSELLENLVGPSFPKDLPIEEKPTDIRLNDPEKRYNAAYRHFDTLIWRVPAWSSALFLAIAASINYFLTSSAKLSTTMIADLNLSTNAFASILIGFFGIFTLILSYALFRFRWHQVGTKTWPQTPSSPWVSPQLLLQLMVNAEGALLLFLSGALAGVSSYVPYTWFGAILVFIILLFCYYEEQQLKTRIINLNLLKMRRTDILDNSDIRGAS